MKKKSIGYISIVMGTLLMVSSLIKAKGVFAKVNQINTESIDYESGFAYGLLASWIIFLAIAIALLYLGYSMIKKKGNSNSTQN